MCSSSHSEWFKQLENIALAFDSGIDNFLMTVTMESSVIEIDHRSFEEKVSEINQILCALRNALSHIHKSGEHFYNTPHPSIYYSGSAHKVLMAYYNFIELILSLGYLKPHAPNTKQSRISFFITFGMINRVRTQIYFKTSVTQENRLVSFELPYAALYDFKKYIPALLHEVYHLIAPTNRDERNRLLLSLWAGTNVKKYLIKYLKQFLDNPSAKNEAQEKKIENTLQTIVDKFLYDTNKDLLDIFFRNVNGYYNTRMGLTQENILALDQEEFVRVLHRFYDDNSYSVFVSFVLTKFDEFLVKDKPNIINYFRKNNASENLVKYIYRIIRRIKAQKKDASIKNTVSEARIEKTLEEKYHIAIKETICDAFFVDLLNWNLKEYLTYMLNILSENLVVWSEVFYQEISVRVGTIICYFYNDSISNEETIDALKVHRWFEKQLESFNFSETSKKELLQLFAIYTRSYSSQFPVFFSLLNYETIKAIFSQITDETDRYVFVQKAITIRALYEKLSQNDLSQQLKGILTLQTDFRSEPKQKKSTVTYEVIYPTFFEGWTELPERITTGNLGDFLSIVTEIKNVYKNSNEELWFRGVCNSTYKLIPSLFRQLPKVSQIVSQPFVAYGYQVATIRQAYLQTKTFYSLMEKNEKPTAARQAFLQHYGIHTNFLDFSTDPLSSLYWALNPDDDEDRQKKDEFDAAVYVFAPEKYQKAVNKIKTAHNLLTQEEANYLYPYHTHNCLSEEYVIDDMSDENVLRQINRAKQYQSRVDGDNGYKYERMPLATVVPQKNDRILAQSGCFVAYNLLSAIDNLDNSKGPFEYLTLERIQEEYIRICKEERIEAERFLYRILIPVVHKDKLNRAIETIFGYSLAKVYPDVDKLFEQANSRINNHFENLQTFE